MQVHATGIFSGLFRVGTLAILLAVTGCRFLPFSCPDKAPRPILHAGGPSLVTTDESSCDLLGVPFRFGFEEDMAPRSAWSRSSVHEFARGRRSFSGFTPLNSDIQPPGWRLGLGDFMEQRWQSPNDIIPRTNDFRLDRSRPGRTESNILACGAIAGRRNRPHLAGAARPICDRRARRDREHSVPTGDDIAAR